jgi:hypothetical protein
MKVKKKADVKGYTSYRRNPWPELDAKLGNLKMSEALHIPAREWRAKFKHSQDPKVNAKVRIRQAAKKLGIKVNVLSHKTREDIIVIKTK